MTLNTLAHGEPWMTPHELHLNQNLIRAIATFLADAGVPDNALLALRVNDVTATWLLARRLESALAPADGQPAPCPTPAQADAIGKCRERLRKGVKELEEYCAKTGAPAPRGLVAQMHQTVNELKAVGFLDKNGFPINPDGGQETENQASATPASPKPENTPPATPASPKPENTPPATPHSPNPAITPPATPHSPKPENTPRATTPDSKPENNAPRDLRQTGADRNDKTRARPPFQFAHDKRKSNYTAIYIPPTPSSRKPTNDTG